MEINHFILYLCLIYLRDCDIFKSKPDIIYNKKPIYSIYTWPFIYKPKKYTCKIWNNLLYKVLTLVPVTNLVPKLVVWNKFPFKRK